MGVVLTGQGFVDVNAGAGETKTLDRDLEPAIIDGARVPALIGEPTNSLYVYTFNGDSLNTAPIPAQVDEVTGDGSYTSFDNGILDARDEIVFMAMDTGDQPSDTSPLNSLDIDTSNWYEIVVIDPTTGRRGWAYLVRRNSSASVSGDYVEYSSKLITTTPHHYQLGFSDTHFGFDFLTLANNGTEDILDRTKVRVSSLGVSVTEDNVPFSPPVELIDGRVRAIVEQSLFGSGSMTTTYLAYGSIAHSLVEADSSITVSSVRTSADLNSGAAGATFYNQNVSAGVTVDGSPDSVAATPFSNWSQVSHTNGRMIQVVDTTPVGGTPKNYYCDDATSSLECDGTSKTGDGFSYGDAGILVDGGVNQTFVFSGTFYFLSPAGGGEADNVGTTYKDYFFNPLNLAIYLTGQRLTTYLPVVLKE
jgi:hypothetical protein